VPAFKPAYLIHGDDHGRIAERRARLRSLAEETSGAQGIELFDGEQAGPDAVAAALCAMTFAFGCDSSSSTASSAGRTRISSR
jgi:DNA polymerase III subunit delta